MTLKYSIQTLLLFALMAGGCSSERSTPDNTSSPRGDSLSPRSSPSASTDILGGRSAPPINPSQLRAGATPRTFENIQGLSGYDQVRELIVPGFTTDMRQKGRTLYQKTCARCHGDDGRPRDTGGRLARYNMANLANPLAYKYGADARGIYRSIAYGTAAPPHGLYKDVYSNQEIWSLVAFIETLDAR